MTHVTSLEFIDAISRAKTVEEIHDACSALCQRFGFDYFHYGAQIPTSLTQPYFIHISGYPKAWWSRYNTEGFIRHDPTVAYCANHLTPLDWDVVTRQERGEENRPQVMHQAQEFGLASGVSCSAHSAQGDFAMFSFASGDAHRHTQSRIQEAIPDTQLFTAYLHETVRKIFMDENLSLAHVRLTEREQECLLWAAEGKTTWETSRILNISERTVTFHIQNAGDKLKVVNRSQAVARAVATGLISPQFN